MRQQSVWRWLAPILAAGALATVSVFPAAVAAKSPPKDPGAKAPKKPDAGDLASNATITGRVKAALLADKVAPGFNIDVDTNEGVVTLKGQVATQQQKMRAEQVAKKVKGVRKVVNKLTVKAKGGAQTGKPKPR
jgi:hyperosmotically inducible periplasmic protein